MKPRDIITQARYLTLDTESEVQRQSDAELLSYVNEALREACVLRSDLFSTVQDLLCVTGTCDQAISFDQATGLIEVLSIKNGPAVTLMDRQAMELFKPSWRSDAAGPAVHWAPMAGDRLAFAIYPKSPAGQVLSVRYVRNPSTYAMDDVIGDLPLAYQPAIADYVVYRAESKDDEHVLNQRAAAHYAAFKTKFGAAANGATVSQ